MGCFTCIYVWGPCANLVPTEARRVCIPLELELQIFVSYSIYAGIELGSFGRKVSALNYLQLQ